MNRRVSSAVLLVLLLSGICPGQQTDAAAEYGRGMEAFRQRDFSTAEAAFFKAEQQSHGFKDALLQRAKALIHLERYKDAETSLEEYLKTHANAADAKFLLGYVLFRENQPQKSLAIYTAAAALQRPLPDDFKIVGLDYVLLNEYPEAIRWLERAVKENPKDAEALYHLGRAYYTQNWFDRAIGAFEQAIKLNPLYAKAHNNLGLALAAQNKADQAEQAYRRAIEIGESGGRKSEQPYINLAELLIERNRVPEALALLGTAREIDPKSDKTEQLRGRALLSENRLAEAESAFRAAIALKPDSGVLHYQLGRVLKRMGRAEDARQEFERSKALLGTRSALPYQ